MTTSILQAQERLETQPFSVLLGARILSVDTGRCELEVPVRDEFKQQHGFLHGGVISYAADNALTSPDSWLCSVPSSRPS